MASAYIYKSLRKTFLLVICGINPFISQGQPQNQPFFSLGIEHIRFDYKYGIGIQAQLNVPVGNKWSIHYSVGAGLADNTGNYSHVPIPAAAGFAITIGTGGIGVPAFLVALIPEGISYTANFTKRMDLRFQMNPLGIYFWNSSVERKDPWIPDIGSMLIIKDNSNNPLIKLDAGLMYQVSTKAVGTKLGVGFCIPL